MPLSEAQMPLNKLKILLDEPQVALNEVSMSLIESNQVVFRTVCLDIYVLISTLSEHQYNRTPVQQTAL